MNNLRNNQRNANYTKIEIISYSSECEHLKWKWKSICPHGLYTIHGILQARILEWVAFPFSRGSSQPRDRTLVSHIAGRFFTSWATREAQGHLKTLVKFIIGEGEKKWVLSWWLLEQSFEKQFGSIYPNVKYASHSTQHSTSKHLSKRNTTTYPEGNIFQGY